ncbi:MAG: hypothetical protein ACRC92_20060, partial [Peptostreptococcaceae bacterium]
KMKFNITKKATTGLIITSILIGNVSTVFADNNTSKEEVVYVKINNNGSVDNVYIINSFDINSNKNIIDYGNYTNVVNLTTNDVLNYSNGLLDSTINSDEEKFYYQGDLSSKEIPWDISISYNLDGKNISAKELAGKSGKLEINMDINENTNVENDFFENYAVQVSMSLDSNKCKNIKSEDGTIANVGSTKSITYIKMPGESASYTLTADVTNFEMDAMIINGLNMGINVDVDLGDMNKDLDTLVDAVGQLDKGTSDLKTGVSNYKTGVNKLTTSSKDLLTGAAQLKNGVNEFTLGVSSVNDGANALNNGLNELSQGSGAYKQNVDEYAKTVAELSNGLKEMLPPEVYENLPLESIVAGAQGLANAYENIDNGINSSMNGLSQLYSATQQLNNSSTSLSQGTDSLYNGIAALNGGSNELLNGINELDQGASKLNDGSSELNKKTSDVPSEIDKKIEELASKYSNSDFEPVSFASEKNENIESVQFTIRTDGIAIEEKKETIKEEEKEENIWQLFLNLFKKEK